MTALEFLNVLSADVSVTIGTEYGNGWCYYREDGYWVTPSREETSIFELFSRGVVWIYPREEREYKRPLKAGIGIVVEGTENGSF